jgi:enterochelin esterase-like enzyme
MEPTQSSKCCGWAAGVRIRFFARVQSLSENLPNHKIRHTLLPTEGRHHYTVWRKYLIEVVPLLFQTK